MTTSVAHLKGNAYSLSLYQSNAIIFLKWGTVECTAQLVENGGLWSPDPVPSHKKYLTP